MGIIEADEAIKKPRSSCLKNKYEVPLGTKQATRTNQGLILKENMQKNEFEN